MCLLPVLRAQSALLICILVFTAQCLAYDRKSLVKRQPSDRASSSSYPGSNSNSKEFIEIPSIDIDTVWDEYQAEEARKQSAMVQLSEEEQRRERIVSACRLAFEAIVSAYAKGIETQSSTKQRRPAAKDEGGTLIFSAILVS